MALGKRDAKPVTWAGKKAGAEPTANSRPLKTIEDTPAYEMQAEALSHRPQSLNGGVNVTWLAAAYRIDTRTARKRLAGLKPVGFSAHGTEIFDFVDAATYLAPPHPEQFARYMRSLRTQDMPTQLQDTYWSALRKRQIWEQHAGQLWKTESVVDVLAEVFKTLKTTMQLWVDNLDQDNDMPEDQRSRLTQMVDGLQNDLYEALVSMPKRGQTPSSLYDPEVITNQDPDDKPPIDDEDLIG